MEDDLLVGNIVETKEESEVLSDDAYAQICKKHLRLRALQYKTPQEAYSFETQGQSTLKDLGWYEYKNLLLEIKKEDDIWEPYHKDDVDINLYEYDEQTEDFRPVRSIRVNQDILVGEMREKIAKNWINYPVNDILMMKLTLMNGSYEAEEISHDPLQLKKYLNT